MKTKKGIRKAMGKISGKAGGTLGVLKIPEKAVPGVIENAAEGVKIAKTAISEHFEFANKSSESLHEAHSEARTAHNAIACDASLPHEVRERAADKSSEETRREAEAQERREMQLLEFARDAMERGLWFAMGLIVLVGGGSILKKQT